MAQNQAHRNHKKSVHVHKLQRKPSEMSDNEFDRKYKAAVRAYYNYMEGLHLVLNDKEESILKILRKRSCPLWFQELTDEQCDACDRLLDAIADDTDERTIHRTRGKLRALGVYPLGPNNVIRTALILCNRNDISFLWTLLELRYMRQPTCPGAGLPKDYSINERLLLSAIAHLDMMTTLRGLDKILPHRPPVGGLVMQMSKKGFRASECRGLPNAPSLIGRRAVKKTGHTIPAQVQPHRDEFLGRYSRYQDPKYIIRNEATRWFAPHRGSKRNLYKGEGYISSAKLCTGTESDSQSTSTAGSVKEIVHKLLDAQIQGMINRVDCSQLLCPTHHDLTDDRGAGLKTICLRESPARVALMEAVEAVRAQWTQEQQRAIGPQEVDGLLKRIIDEAVTLAILEPATKCPECRQRFELQQKLLNGHQCVCTPEADARPLPLPMDVKQRYFRFTDKPVPYEFDYRKIMGKTDGLCPIKGAIKRAFRGQDTDDSSSTNTGEMIERFMKRSWDEEKELWNRQMAENKKPTLDSDTETKDRLDISTVDIKDLKSLKELLKRALHELAENPKYILATFPEAHKLPILVAWIRDRYGLRISPEERETARLESQYFWNYLIPRATAVRWPTRLDTDLSARVNWDYKEKLETMTNTMRHRFYRRFKKVDIEEGRLWWASMAAYHSGPGRFRQTFSAYFPNCEPMMVPIVRPWQTHQHRTGVRPASGGN